MRAPGAPRYRPADIYVTENGCDVPGEDAIPLPDVLDDTFRVDFYRGYVQAAQEAVTYDAVPLRGYFAWSLLGARPPRGRAGLPRCGGAGRWLCQTWLRVLSHAPRMPHGLSLGAGQPAPCRSPLPVERGRVRHPWALPHAQVSFVEHVAVPFCRLRVLARCRVRQRSLAALWAAQTTTSGRTATPSALASCTSTTPRSSAISSAARACWPTCSAPSRRCAAAPRRPACGAAARWWVPAAKLGGCMPACCEHRAGWAVGWGGRE